MAEAALETILRRDQVIVATALALLTVLAWSYVLWLAVDMDMGGMHMTGFRMVAAGVGIMAPASAPWRMIEFAFAFVMWLVMMVGMMAPSTLRRGRCRGAAIQVSNTETAPAFTPYPGVFAGMFATF